MRDGRFNPKQDLVQILSVLEGASEEHINQTLRLMEMTDPIQANLVRSQLLTFERVLLLDDESLSRVLEDFDDKQLSRSIRNSDLELRKRALKMINAKRKTEVLNLIKTENPTSVEVDLARRKLIQRTRELEKKGRIHLGSIKGSSRNKKKAA